MRLWTVIIRHLLELKFIHHSLFLFQFLPQTGNAVRYKAAVGYSPLADNMLGSGVVTAVSAVIMWFTLMVYNYSQINYLQQTVVLCNEAENNQGFSAEHYNTTSPSICLFLRCLYYCVLFSSSPLLPPSFNLILWLTCSVTSLPIEGSSLSHTHTPFNQRVFGMMNVCSPLVDEVSLLPACLIRVITAPRALFSLSYNSIHSLATISFLLSWLSGQGWKVRGGRRDGDKMQSGNRGWKGSNKKQNVCWDHRTDSATQKANSDNAPVS